MMKFVISKFSSGEEGAAAVEFALVAPIFFLLIFSTMEIGLKTLVQSDLDHAMYRTAMQLAIDEDVVVSKAEYKQRFVCDPATFSTLDCDRISFGVEALATNSRIRGRFNEVFVDRWNTGCGGSNLIVEFAYPSPDILLPFGIADMITIGGDNYIRSRGLIRREPVLTGSGTLEGGATC